MRANFQSSYLRRYMIVTAVFLGAALWFGYDGVIGYPKQLQKAKAYEQLDQKSSDFEDEWKAVTAENGWSTDFPKDSHEIESDIVGQYFYSAIGWLIGLPFLFLVIKSRNAWVERTPDGVKASNGQTMAYSDVTQLDKSKWAKKGIAKAHYRVDGMSRVFVFDDFKFDREPIGQMLKELESTLTPDQISGDSEAQDTTQSDGPTSHAEEVAPSSEPSE